jgi:hypothetical protein
MLGASGFPFPFSEQIFPILIRAYQIEPRRSSFLMLRAEMRGREHRNDPHNEDNKEQNAQDN